MVCRLAVHDCVLTLVYWDRNLGDRAIAISSWCGYQRHDWEIKLTTDYRLQTTNITGSSAGFGQFCFI